MNRHAFIGTAGAAAGFLTVLFNWLPVGALAPIAGALGSVFFLPTYAVFLNIPPWKVKPSSQ
jgi:hypothetical protein